jgi:hypothetical protein
MKSQSKYSVWLTLLFPLGMCLVLGCSVYQQKRRNPECRELFDLIEHGWYRDSSSLYHLTAKVLAVHRFGNFHDDECLIGLSSKSVVRLFGKPDTVREDFTMEYFNSKPCLEGGTNSHGCHSMIIRFDAEGGLKSILFGSTSVDID